MVCYALPVLLEQIYNLALLPYDYIKCYPSLCELQSVLCAGCAPF